MSLVNPRAFCVLMGEKDCHPFRCHGAGLPIAKKSSYGAESLGSQALAEIPTTPYDHLITDSDFKAFKVLPGRWAGQG